MSNSRKELLRMSQKLGSSSLVSPQASALAQPSMLEHGDALKSRIPPLDIILYAIKGILYPTPIYEQIPGLIRLLTMAEFHRLRAINIASNALSIQSYYQDNPDPSVMLLSDETEGYFKAFVDTGSSAEWRAMFMKLLSICCAIDVLQVWFHDSDTDFWLRWNEYFAVLDPLAEKPAKLSHIFHYALSTHDIDQLRAAASHCVGLLEHAEDEQLLYALSSQSYEKVLQTEELQERQHLPKMDAPFQKVVESYLATVHGVVEYVTGTLKDEQQ
ncbi:unnamed protein product [Cyclocybe aegerita]|uniref:Uncharacterized protein n=1 Tax=Cyclocybe aegerita TaxID=1973307 RepID=A0A8S0XGF5_CYCAE|nr:unnamed protein product [Cyclocybe aegerita]